MSVSTNSATSNRILWFTDVMEAQSLASRNVVTCFKVSTGKLLNETENEEVVVMVVAVVLGETSRREEALHLGEVEVDMVMI
jgi:hypothetical protein